MKKHEIEPYLPWLLNGTLDADEKRAVEAELESREEQRRALRDTADAWDIYSAHVPAQSLTTLVLEPSSLGEMRDIYEQHLSSCDECAELLKMARESHGHFDEAPLGEAAAAAAPSGDGEVIAFPPRPSAPAPRWRLAAIAAGLTAVVAAAGWFWTLRQFQGLDHQVFQQASAQRQIDEKLTDLEQENTRLRQREQELVTARQQAEGQIADLEEQLSSPPGPKPGNPGAGNSSTRGLSGSAPSASGPRLNVPVLDVYSDMVLRGDGSEALNELPIPPGMEEVILILGSQPATGDGPRAYRLELSGADKILWRIDGLRRHHRGDFTVTLPVADLPTTDLTLRILAGEKEVERYRLRIVTP